MYDIVLCVYERFRVDGLKRYVNDDRFRVDGDKNMRLLAFAFTVVFVWTGPYTKKREMINIPVPFIKESYPETVCKPNFLLYIFSKIKRLFATLLQKKIENLLNFPCRSLLKRLWLPWLSLYNL